jgi:hypothetical protein
MMNRYRARAIPIDAFAYELLHGSWLTEQLLMSALHSLTPLLAKRYPDLAKAAQAAEEALWQLYQQAGRAWDQEAKAAEETKVPQP